MAGHDTGKAHRPLAENAPGLDVMLGLWTSWMDRISDAARGPDGERGNDQQRDESKQEAMVQSHILGRAKTL